jgi:hypothetical protein
MAARTAPVALVVALLLAGCARDAESVPAACLGDPAAIEQALARAPARVTLSDGTPLSTCVSRARNDAELQTLGTSLMRVADHLTAYSSADRVATMRLGYLIGAARRGARKNPGLAANLVRRLEQTGPSRGGKPETLFELRRGERAGEAGG